MAALVPAGTDHDSCNETIADERARAERAVATWREEHEARREAEQEMRRQAGLHEEAAASWQEAEQRASIATKNYYEELDRREKAEQENERQYAELRRLLVEEQRFVDSLSEAEHEVSRLRECRDTWKAQAESSERRADMLQRAKDAQKNKRRVAQNATKAHHDGMEYLKGVIVRLEARAEQDAEDADRKIADLQGNLSEAEQRAAFERARADRESHIAVQITEEFRKQGNLFAKYLQHVSDASASVLIFYRDHGFTDEEVEAIERLAYPEVEA